MVHQLATVVGRTEHHHAADGGGVVMLGQHTDQDAAQGMRDEVRDAVLALQAIGDGGQQVLVHQHRDRGLGGWVVEVADAPPLGLQCRGQGVHGARRAGEPMEQDNGAIDLGVRGLCRVGLRWTQDCCGKC